jgi:hypothetical protein
MITTLQTLQIPLFPQARTSDFQMWTTLLLMSWTMVESSSYSLNIKAPIRTILVFCLFACSFTICHFPSCVRLFFLVYLCLSQLAWYSTIAPENLDGIQERIVDCSASVPRALEGLKEEFPIEPALQALHSDRLDRYYPSRTRLSTRPYWGYNHGMLIDKLGL